MNEGEINPTSPADVSPAETAQIAPDRRFFGSYAHSLDSKGRMILPNVYRIPLGKKFTVGPTMDYQGIALYPDEVFEQILSRISSPNQFQPAIQKALAQLAKLSYREMQTDTQGRLLLPAKLRQRMLGEAKELEISGALTHIRVMSSDKADADDAYFTEHLEEILNQVGNLTDTTQPN